MGLHVTPRSSVSGGSERGRDGSSQMVGGGVESIRVSDSFFTALALSLLLYHTPYDGRWDGRQRQHQRLRAAHAATATNEFFLESTIVFVIFLVLPLQQFKCL